MAAKKERISRIAVRGFKSIQDEQEIEVCPLTLLAGANSSGKSSIMQPLLLLKQTLDEPGDSGPLLFNGPNVRFTSSEQFLSRCPGKTTPQEFSVRLELTSGQRLELVYERRREGGLEIKWMEYKANKHKERNLKMFPQMTSEELENFVPADFKKFIQKNFAKRDERVEWHVQRDRCFLFISARIKNSHRMLPRFLPFSGLSPSTGFIPYIRNVIHVPGLRGNPERAYPKRAYGGLFQGTFQEYVASIIARWQSDRDVHFHKLAKALEGIGLTWKAQAKPLDDATVEVKVGRLTHSKVGGAHDLVSIADVGFGLSQSLPVIVALIAAEPGQIVYLEQPEIHLHPRAQRSLAHVMSEAAKQGVVVIAETHSSLLLKEIQTIVAKSELPKEDVKLHWFERDESSGVTTIKSASLDKDGAFGDWPSDFDEVELKAEKEYLDAVEDRNAKE
jgi:hypothetical protein